MKPENNALRDIKISLDLTLSQRQQRTTVGEEVREREESGKRDIAIRMIHGNFQVIETRKEYHHHQGPRLD